MKLLAVLALNVLVAGTGILFYDVMTTAPEPAAAEGVDLSELTDRVADLERAVRADSNRGDRGLSSRIAMLEERVTAQAGAKPMTSDTAAVASDPVRATPAASAGVAETLPVDDDLAVERLKKLMERVEQDRRSEREARGMERMLDRLGVELTEEQRKRVGEEMTAHRGRIRETFRTGREAGLERDDIRASMEGLRQELATTLTSFLPAETAQTIANSTGPDGPGGGGGPGGGRGGNRGGRGGGGGGIR